MSDRPLVASFDCYGTLIDWEGGLASFLYDFALRKGDEPVENGDALRRRWETIQFDLIQGAYRPYKEILAESLRLWCAQRGLPYDGADGAALTRAMRSWQPFPDTGPALTAARDAGVRLAILSNTDRDIIAHSLKHIGVPFDLVVTAEDCGSYKPALGNFERLLRELDTPLARVLHVAFGFKYDIEPANALGMRSAWVNRHVEPMPAGAKPDHEWRDLWGLSRFAGAAGPGIP
jgi:2-haloalkanoic acid dehalogenase type II